ncbi:uncharacterized protein AMSG_08695 [Thecamonas trahens ATCC 50062]|uniref:Guanylate cyclase domain-containing protein n=1 Tax=Thecamonas trahens ATCC 50062 TaxID=461836 RepID=A0A0L0DK65_THETB|nr:hypothetical protein AMSG_08695 [Thecamonas trahens ATCC 50062]KNC52804.1 hypothetical protein AMSG_08695 [Thecamonas trahens ATCC 50062]|eukprot:XP_013755113.1 hypothetical protein AMSG_08695 [Thecamonas trahens ATCC 50062]
MFTTPHHSFSLAAPARAPALVVKLVAHPLEEAFATGVVEEVFGLTTPRARWICLDSQEAAELVDVLAELDPERAQPYVEALAQSAPAAIQVQRYVPGGPSRNLRYLDPDACAGVFGVPGELTAHGRRVLQDIGRMLIADLLLNNYGRLRCRAVWPYNIGNAKNVLFAADTGGLVALDQCLNAYDPLRHATALDKYATAVRDVLAALSAPLADAPPPPVDQIRRFIRQNCRYDIGREGCHCVHLGMLAGLAAVRGATLDTLRDVFASAAAATAAAPGTTAHSPPTGDPPQLAFVLAMRDVLAAAGDTAQVHAELAELASAPALRRPDFDASLAADDEVADEISEFWKLSESLMDMFSGDGGASSSLYATPLRDAARARAAASSAATPGTPNLSPIPPPSLGSDAAASTDASAPRSAPSPDGFSAELDSPSRLAHHHRHHRRRRRKHSSPSATPDEPSDASASAPSRRRKHRHHHGDDSEPAGPASESDIAPPSSPPPTLVADDNDSEVMSRKAKAKSRKAKAKSRKAKSQKAKSKKARAVAAAAAASGAGGELAPSSAAAKLRPAFSDVNNIRFHHGDRTVLMAKLAPLPMSSTSAALLAYATAVINYRLTFREVVLAYKCSYVHNDGPVLSATFHKPSAAIDAALECAARAIALRAGSTVLGSLAPPVFALAHGGGLLVDKFTLRQFGVAVDVALQLLFRVDHPVALDAPPAILAAPATMLALSKRERAAFAKAGVSFAPHASDRLDFEATAVIYPATDALDDDMELSALALLKQEQAVGYVETLHGNMTPAMRFRKLMVARAAPSTALSPSKLNHIDGVLTSAAFFGLRAMVALGFDWMTVPGLTSAEDVISKMRAAMALLQPVVLAHGGTFYEEFLYEFESPSVALAAAIAIKRELIHHNASAFVRERAPLRGLVCSHGPTLAVEATNVHWGRHVTLAQLLLSSFAVTAATVADPPLMLTSAFHAALLESSDPNIGALTLAPVSFTIGDAAERCYAVKGDAALASPYKQLLAAGAASTPPPASAGPRAPVASSALKNKYTSSRPADGPRVRFALSPPPSPPLRPRLQASPSAVASPPSLHTCGPARATSPVVVNSGALVLESSPAMHVFRGGLAVFATSLVCPLPASPVAAAALTFKLQELCMPLLQSFGALTVQPQDSGELVALLPTPAAAAAAALAAHELIAAFNQDADAAGSSLLLRTTGFAVVTGDGCAQSAHHEALLVSPLVDAALALASASDLSSAIRVCLASDDFELVDDLVSQPLLASAHLHPLTAPAVGARLAHLTGRSAQSLALYTISGSLPSEAFDASALLAAGASAEASYSGLDLEALFRSAADAAPAAAVVDSVTAHYVRQHVAIVTLARHPRPDMPPAEQLSTFLAVLNDAVVPVVVDQYGGERISATAFAFVDDLLSATSAAVLIASQPLLADAGVSVVISDGDVLVIPYSDSTVFMGEPLRSPYTALAGAKRLHAPPTTRDPSRVTPLVPLLVAAPVIAALALVEPFASCYAYAPVRGAPDFSYVASISQDPRVLAGDVVVSEDEDTRHFVGHVAVLVTDMSGFTRITRAKGIVHFASLILRMRSLFTPIFELYGALSINTEADNFLVVFPSAEKATAAALEAARMLHLYNAAVVADPAVSDDFVLKVGGYGIAAGRGCVQDLMSTSLFGEVFDRAFRLGEDVADDNILIDDTTASLAGKHPAFAGLDLSRLQVDAETGIRYTTIELDAAVSSLARYHGTLHMVSSEFDTTTPLGWVCNAVLNAAPDDVAAAAADVGRRYLAPGAILLIGVDQAKVTAAAGIDASIRMLHRMVHDLEPILIDELGGSLVEEKIFLFRSPAAAIRGAVLARALLNATNASAVATGLPAVPWTGIAVHIGDMLVVPGSNIHWGDPLNTASKLAEDVASGQEIFVTREAFDAACAESPDLARLPTTSRTFHVSKVDLPCLEVGNGECITAGRVLGSAAVGEHRESQVRSGEVTAASDAAARAAFLPPPQPATISLHDSIEFTSETTLLVSDMSGFSRITRKMGIIHFASLILRMRTLAKGVYERYGVLEFFTEADNTFGLFATPAAAAAAAFELKAVLDAYNAEVAPAADFRIKVGGYGMHCGPGVVKDTATGKFFGTVADGAFVLGEDVSEDAALYVSTPVLSALATDERFARMDVVSFTAEDSPDAPFDYHVLACPGLNGTLPAAQLLTKLMAPAAWAPADNTTAESRFLAAVLVDRLAAGTTVSALDAKLADEFMVSVAAVLLIGMDFASVSASSGVPATLALVHSLSGLLATVAKRYGGTPLEEFIFLFPDVDAGYAAGLAIRAALVEYSMAHPNAPAPLTGLALHTGSMLIVPGTNVHWGDPLNTASKLAEDSASSAEFLVTQAAARLLASRAGATFVERSFVVSKVELPCVEVLDAVATSALASRKAVRALGMGKPLPQYVTTDAHCRHYHGEYSVLISDMSGFTRITRKMGIIHFASLILRMRDMLLAIYGACGAVSTFTEADNTFAVFRTPAAALRAALEAQVALARYNATSLPSPDFELHLSGFGIDTGVGLVQDLRSDKLFGPVHDRAFVLAEDTATGTDILISDETMAVLDADRAFVWPASITAEAKVLGEDDFAAPFGYFHLHGRLAASEVTLGHLPVSGSHTPREPRTPASEFHHALLVERPSARGATEQVDAQVTASYMRSPVFCLLIGFDFASVTATTGVENTIALMHGAEETVHAAIAPYSGEAVEEFIFVFNSAKLALLAGLAASAALDEWNELASADRKLPLLGMAIHAGSMLIVPGTNLAEDSLDGGELCITVPVYDAISRLSEFANLEFESREYLVSKVTLPCMIVRAPDRSGTHSDAHCLHYDGARAVVNVDVAGFTAAMRAAGIIHAAYMVLRMRALLGPVFTAHGAELVLTEADNLVAVFASADNAVAAACEAHYVMKTYNTWASSELAPTLPSRSRASDKVTSSLYGEPVDEAHHLADEVATEAQVLLTNSTRAALRSSSLALRLAPLRASRAEPASMWPFEYVVVDEATCSSTPRKSRMSNVAASALNEASTEAELAEHAGGADGSEASTFMNLMLQLRGGAGAATDTVDVLVSHKFVTEAAVVYVALDMAAVTRKYGSVKAIAVVHNAVAMVAQAVAEQSGVSVLEPFVLAFENKAHGVSAAIAILRAIERYNTDGRVAAGELLVVDGTDIHWGEALNTAAKLAHVMAASRELLVTEEVAKATRSDPAFAALRYEPREAVASGLAFKAFAVEWAFFARELPSSPGSRSDGVHFRELSGTHAVVVSDMSGFTRITRAKGIVHFASLIYRMREIIRAAYEAAGAVAFHTEADNTFGVFESAAAALEGALQAKSGLRAYNESVVDPDLAIAFSGFGVDVGEDLIRDTGSLRLFGSAAERAFVLAEDTADGGAVLVSGAVAARVRGTAAFKHAKFVRQTSDELDFVFYEVIGGESQATGSLPLTGEYAPAREEHVHGSPAAVFRTAVLSSPRALDVAASFLRPHAVVLLVGLEWRSLTEAAGPRKAILVAHEVAGVVADVLSQLGGTMLEEFIYAFDSPEAAISGALQLRKLFRERTAKHAEAEDVPLLGFGVHSGEMLIVPGTNVHWGDPLNTASKLAEDIAREGQLYVTQPVWHRLSGEFRRSLRAGTESHTVSKVALQVMRVDNPGPVSGVAVSGTVRSAPAVGVVEDAHTRRYTSEVAVLVSDMSGMSRTTAKYGIIHFAYLILKMRDLLSGVWEHYGAVSVATEADDFIVVFPSLDAALTAALEAFHILDAYHAALPAERLQAERINVSGFGIAVGDDVVADAVTGRLFGSTFNEAFLLGEELTDGGQVLLSTAAARRVMSDPQWACVACEPRMDVETSTTFAVVTGKLPAYECSLAQMSVPTIPWGVHTPGGEFYTDMLVKRPTLAGRDQAALDDAIKARFFSTKYVVMLGFDFSAKEAADSIDAAVASMHTAVAETHPRAAAHGGVAIEEFIFAFDSGSAAFAAASDMKAALVACGFDAVPFTGIALHAGDMLIVPETNVHWGSPLNTASKLSEDVASAGEFFVSRVVMDELRRNRLVRDVETVDRVFTVSKMDFECVEILGTKGGIASASASESPALTAGDTSIISVDLNGSDDFGVSALDTSQVLVVVGMPSLARTLRREGLEALASAVVRMQQLVGGCIAAGGGEAFGRGDEIVGVFDDALVALQVATKIHEVVREFNAAAGAARLSAIGVAVVPASTTLVVASVGGVYGQDVELGRDLVLEGAGTKTVVGRALVASLSERASGVSFISGTSEGAHVREYAMVSGAVAIDGPLAEASAARLCASVDGALGELGAAALSANNGGALRAGYIASLALVRFVFDFGVKHADGLAQLALSIVSGLVPSDAVDFGGLVYGVSNVADGLEFALNVRDALVEFGASATGAATRELPFVGGVVKAGEVVRDASVGVVWGGPVLELNQASHMLRPGQVVVLSASEADLGDDTRFAGLTFDKAVFGRSVTGLGQLAGVRVSGERSARSAPAVVVAGSESLPPRTPRGRSGSVDFDLAVPSSPSFEARGFDLPDVAEEAGASSSASLIVVLAEVQVKSSGSSASELVAAGSSAVRWRSLVDSVAEVHGVTSLSVLSDASGVQGLCVGVVFGSDESASALQFAGELVVVLQAFNASVDDPELALRLGTVMVHAGPGVIVVPGLGAVTGHGLDAGLAAMRRQPPAVALAVSGRLAPSGCGWAQVERASGVVNGLPAGDELRVAVAEVIGNASGAEESFQEMALERYKAGKAHRKRLDRVLARFVTARAVIHLGLSVMEGAPGGAAAALEAAHAEMEALTGAHGGSAKAPFTVAFHETAGVGAALARIVGALNSGTMLSGVSGVLVNGVGVAFSPMVIDAASQLCLGPAAAAAAAGGRSGKLVVYVGAEGVTHGVAAAMPAELGLEPVDDGECEWRSSVVRLARPAAGGGSSSKAASVPGRASGGECIVWIDVDVGGKASASAGAVTLAGAQRAFSDALLASGASAVTTVGEAVVGVLPSASAALRGGFEVLHAAREVTGGGAGVRKIGVGVAGAHGEVHVAEGMVFAPGVTTAATLAKAVLGRSGEVGAESRVASAGLRAHPGLSASSKVSQSRGTAYAVVRGELGSYAGVAISRPESSTVHETACVSVAFGIDYGYVTAQLGGPVAAAACARRVTAMIAGAAGEAGRVVGVDAAVFTGQVEHVAAMAVAAARKVRDGIRAHNAQASADGGAIIPLRSVAVFDGNVAWEPSVWGPGLRDARTLAHSYLFEGGRVFATEAVSAAAGSAAQADVDVEYLGLREVQMCEVAR